MGEIILVRHGQANSAATNEADYDKLSDLGHQQAAWLGDWIRSHDGPFDHVYSGSLRRQRETVAGMGYTDVTVDPRLNEIAYYDLTAEMEANDLAAPRESKDDFVTHFPATLTAWRDGHITGAETYDNYGDRVRGMLNDAAQPGRRILCVSSGGIIARAVAHILDLDIPKMAQVALPIVNTSVHRIFVRDHGLMLGTFNSTPHLDRSDRTDARTFY